MKKHYNFKYTHTPKHIYAARCIHYVHTHRNHPTAQYSVL